MHMHDTAHAHMRTMHAAMSQRFLNNHLHGQTAEANFLRRANVPKKSCHERTGA